MLRQRVITGIMMASGTIAAAVLLPNAGFALFTLVVVLGGAWEWSQLVGHGSARLRTRDALVFGSCVVAAGILLMQGHPYLVVHAGAIWWLVALIILAIYRPGIARSSRARMGMAIAGLFVLIPAWVSLVVIHRHNTGILLFLLAVIVAADTAAFFTGRRWGKTKLAPELSPGKTREGLFGALAATGLIGLVGAWLFRIDLWMWPYFIALVWITTLLSVTGDLFESLLKREAGVKDSGNLLPGHGGVLDRIDSLTAGAPAFALGFHWLEA